MKHFYSLLMVALLWPALALALPPPNVTGLLVEIEDDGIEVSWEDPDSNDITGYRVYYSTKSILSNEGEYDDFEETQKSRYTFTDLPAGQTVYVAVLAVNAAGEESSVFLEEVSIRVPDAPELSLDDAVMPGSEPSEPAEPITDEPEPMETEPEEETNLQLPTKPDDMPHQSEQPDSGKQVLDSAAHTQRSLEPLGNGFGLLGAKAINPTTAVLTFSHAVTVEPQRAPEAFKVVSADGKLVSIKRVIIEGTTVRVETDPLQKGAVYQAMVFEPLMGAGNLPLHAQYRSAVVVGHEQGPDTAPAVAPAPPTIPTATDIQNLALRAQRDQGGYYSVAATWTPVDATTISHYIAVQTWDGGRTFSPPQPVAPTSNGLTVGGLPSGQFGLLVQAIGSNGQPLSGGALAQITLPRDGSHPVPVQGSVTPPPPAPQPQPIAPPPGKGPGPVVPVPRPGYLPNSGPITGLLAVLAVGLAVGNWAIRRRKNMLKTA